jgi:hypothetical protein
MYIMHGGGRMLYTQMRPIDHALRDPIQPQPAAGESVDVVDC